MTNEEAAYVLTNLYRLDSVKDAMLFSKAFNTAINALKVLESIRAELHATAELHEDGDYYLRDEWIDEIFDKYKEESGAMND